MNPDSSTPAPVSYADLRRLMALVFYLVVAVAFARAVLPILLLFVVVFFLALVLNSPVAWLVRRGVKRALAVAQVIVAVVGVLSLVGLLVVPPVVDQVNDLVERRFELQIQIEGHMDNLAERFPPLQGSLDTLAQWPQELEQHASQIASLVQTLTTRIASAFIYGVLALLLLMFVLFNPQPLVAGFLGAVPDRHREAARNSLARLMVQMTVWVRATLVVGLITGVSTGTLFYIIGLPYAFVFGVLAFFGEFVPSIGPVVASLPALLIAAAESPQTVLWTLLAILFVQQVESNLLVPFIMGREMELHPVSIIFFALTMGVMFGFAGAILAVPLASTAKILWDEFYTRPNAVPVREIDAQAHELVRGEARVDIRAADEEAEDEAQSEIISEINNQDTAELERDDSAAPTIRSEEETT